MDFLKAIFTISGRCVIRLDCCSALAEAVVYWCRLGCEFYFDGLLEKRIDHDRIGLIMQNMIFKDFVIRMHIIFYEKKIPYNFIIYIQWQFI